ncbi:MAG: hypothetical protein J0M09_15985 [Xanthomonadales bacterium]|nr:hypothetical protein [Xanthomonadales bacterium]
MIALPAQVDRNVFLRVAKRAHHPALRVTCLRRSGCNAIYSRADTKPVDACAICRDRSPWLDITITTYPDSENTLDDTSAPGVPPVWLQCVSLPG